MATLAKLTRPDAGDALLRDHLFIQLDEVRRHPVIWICAPAGAGKTTLVSSYIKSREQKNIWYQVDEGDADMATFFHYLGLAVKETTSARKKMPALTPEYQRGVPEFTRNYFRELFQRFTSPCLLVFDNFQEAGLDSDLIQLLPNVFDEIPKGSNVIIVSRSEPPASYSRVRANQQLYQINWAELKFTIDEQLAITQKRYANRNISKSQILRLNVNIQGWITGLILLLEQGVDLETVNLDPKENNHEYLFDYFAFEIFQKIDPETQQFLMKTALLPKMTLSICKQLTGNSAAKAILSELVCKQYFTIRHGLWKPSYEYHPLFREFLLTQAQDTFADQDFKTLQSEAGALLVEAGYIDYASSLLINGENWPALGKLILTLAKQQIEQGRNQQVISWIRALPNEELIQQPWFTYWLAQAHLQYDNNTAREFFEISYKKFKQIKDVKGLYLSWCGVADAYVFAFDTFIGADHWVQELQWLRQAHPEPLILEVRAHLIFSASGLLMWMQPDHQDLPSWMGKLENIHRYIPNKNVTAISAVQLSIYYTQMGDMSKVRHIADRTNKLYMATENSPLLQALLCISVYSADWMTADFKKDNAFIDNTHAKIREAGIKIFSGVLLAQAFYHTACQRDLPRLKKLLESLNADIDDESTLGRSHYQQLLAYYEILQGDFARALQYAEVAFELVKYVKAPFPCWATTIILAYIHTELGQFQRAQALLDNAQHVVNSMGSHSGIWMAELFRCYLAFQQHDEANALIYLKTCFNLGRKKDIKVAGIWPPRLVSTLCALALAHDIEPEYAKSIIRIYNYTPQDSLYVSERWPWPIKIYTLGRFSILLNDHSMDTKSRPFDLLKVLLAFGGRNVHEEKIMDALWPKAEGDHAHASFKITLHRLRKVFADIDLLVLKNSQLSLNEQVVWVDAWAMSRCFASVDKSIHSNSSKLSTDLSTDLSSDVAKKILQYYRGHFLSNEVAPWSIYRRESLRLQFIRYSTVLAQSFEGNDCPMAIECYQRLLEIDPLIETAYQGLIRCYQAQERQAEAHAVFNQCSEILMRASGVLPSIATTKLIEK